MFALSKAYASGGQAYRRPIGKPVAGTVKIAVAGVSLGGGQYAVDHATGLVELAVALAEGIRMR